MKILAIAATNFELNPLRARVSGAAQPLGVEVDFLVTGVGVTATSYALTKALCASHRYSLVLDVGIAGSYSESLSPSDVCVVEREVFGDVGVEEAGEFSAFFEQGLLSPNEFPFVSGELACPYIANYPALRQLPSVRSITVNTVSALAETAAMRMRKFSPAVESMEGAAVFYVCLKEGVPFIQLRAISNKVGVRDKEEWRTPQALAGLAEVAGSFIRSLTP